MRLNVTKDKSIQDKIKECGKDQKEMWKTLKK